MIIKLLVWSAATAALLAPLVQGTTVGFTVSGAGTFSGPAPNSNFSFPSDSDVSFSAPFSSNYSTNQNVTASPTFFGAPGDALQQGSALGKFTFTDNTSSVATNSGPIDLVIDVTIGSSSQNLTFVGNLVTNGNTLDINYTPQGGQFTETLYDSTYNVSGTYVMQDFDGYDFGVLESTLAESSVIDSKQVGIDGVVVSAAPEPGTVFTLGLTGAGLLALGCKKRLPKKS